MDLTMSIAATAVSLNNYKIDQQMDTAIMKMAMEAQTDMMSDMLEAVDASAMTGIGMSLDIMA